MSTFGEYLALVLDEKFYNPRYKFYLTKLACWRLIKLVSSKRQLAKYIVQGKKNWLIILLEAAEQGIALSGNLLQFAFYHRLAAACPNHPFYAEMHSGICQSDSCLKWERLTFPPFIDWLAGNRALKSSQDFLDLNTQLQALLLSKGERVDNTPCFLTNSFCPTDSWQEIDLQSLAEKNKTEGGGSDLPNQTWETGKSWDLGTSYDKFCIKLLPFSVFCWVFAQAAFIHCQGTSVMRVDEILVGVFSSSYIWFFT